MVSIDYEVPADYRDGELKASSFTKKGKQAHELLSMIIIPKIGSTSSCSKFERVMVYAITKGMQVYWHVSILYRIMKVIRHMIYKNLVMEIFMAYELDMEGYNA